MGKGRDAPPGLNTHIALDLGTEPSGVCTPGFAYDEYTSSADLCAILQFFTPSYFYNFYIGRKRFIAALPEGSTHDPHTRPLLSLIYTTCEWGIW